MWYFVIGFIFAMLLTSMVVGRSPELRMVTMVNVFVIALLFTGIVLMWPLFLLYLVIVG